MGVFANDGGGCCAFPRGWSPWLPDLGQLGCRCLPGFHGSPHVLVFQPTTLLLLSLRAAGTLVDPLEVPQV